jgi:hypothetical protein
MNLRITPGPAASATDRIAARQIHRLVKHELPQVRAAALAWRNGIGVLLAGLIGFGLLKGRTDVGQLSAPYGALVGVILLSSLLAGTAAALLLLRAAHGYPGTVSLQSQGQDHDPSSRSASDHSEALHAGNALSWGLGLCLLCMALLVTAVGMTWYGPSKDKPGIEVNTPGGTRCGEVVRLAEGQLTLKIDSGEITVDLRRAEALKAVDSCSGQNP